MRELDEILNAWRGFQDAHQPGASGNEQDAVLATVVHVAGSAYRRPGARMLLAPGGRRIGSVSGGCLEGEISKKAWWWTESGEPSLRVYDTSSDDDAVWEFGLGCNGIVQVLLERVASPEVEQMLEFLEDRQNEGAGAVVATVIRSSGAARVGQRLLVHNDEIAGKDLLALHPSVLERACEAYAGEASSLLVLDDCEVFLEYIPPPQELVIFGAGHDAQPLVRFAVSVGWRVTVADGRPSFAKACRFPEAHRVVTLHPSDYLAELNIGPRTAVVMMTHNYPLDRRLLALVMERHPRYLGLLGPKARAERLFAESGLTPPAYLHAPAGLDLGGEAPAAIALSIVSEIQAVFGERPGGMLRLRDGAIHDPAREIGAASRYSHDAARPAYCETVAAHV